MIVFDNGPARLIESSCVPIRAWGSIGWQCLDSIPYFILCNHGLQICKINPRSVESNEIQSRIVWQCCAYQPLKIIEHGLLLVNMRCTDLTIRDEFGNKVLALSKSRLAMEESGVSIIVFQKSNA